MDPQQDQEYYQGQSPEVSDSFLASMIDVQEDINKFEMEYLRRKRLKVNLKDNTKTWVPIAQGVAPICNELGIQEIMGELRSKATKIGRLTKKTDIEIMKEMHIFDRTLIDKIAKRADDWELDEELAKSLKEAIINLVQDVVFSSRGGFTAMNVRSSYGRHENVSTSTPQEARTGLLGLGGRR
jgi:hypothetical protein